MYNQPIITYFQLFIIICHHQPKENKFEITEVNGKKNHKKENSIQKLKFEIEKLKT